MTKRTTTAKAAKTQRVKHSYNVTFRLNIKQDETGTSKVFDAENSIRDALETWLTDQGSDLKGHGNVHFVDVEEVGATVAEDESW
jgi:hypothetical protein